MFFRTSTCLLKALSCPVRTSVAVPASYPPFFHLLKSSTSLSMPSIASIIPPTIATPPTPLSTEDRLLSAIEASFELPTILPIRTSAPPRFATNLSTPFEALANILPIPSWVFICCLIFSIPFRTF